MGTGLTGTPTHARYQQRQQVTTSTVYKLRYDKYIYIL